MKNVMVPWLSMLPFWPHHFQVKKISCGGKTFTIGYDPDAWLPTPITGKSTGFLNSILQYVFS